MIMLVSCVAFAADGDVPKYGELIDGLFRALAGIPKVGDYVVSALKWIGVCATGLTGLSLILSMVNAGLKTANKEENGVLSKIINGIEVANSYIKFVSLRNATPKQ